MDFDQLLLPNQFDPTVWNKNLLFLKDQLYW